MPGRQKPRIEAMPDGTIQINRRRTTRRYLGKYRRAMVVRFVLTCCGHKLSELQLHLDPADPSQEGPCCRIEPYGQLTQDDAAYGVKLNVVCPRCGSDTLIGSNHQYWRMLTQLREAYLQGVTEDHTWEVDVVANQPKPARRVDER